MRRDYELGFILNPEVSEEQTGAILERIEKIVKNYDGQVVKVNQWGRRRLAYPIEHHRDGYYVFIDMILTPETVLELDRNLKVSEEVMRHIVKRRDPKAVQKEREEREARAAAAATQAQASAAAKSEAEVEVQAPAKSEAEVEVQAPVESAAEVEAQAPVESEAEVEVQAPVESAAEVEVQTPVESTTEPEEEIPVVGEEPVVLSPEEMEYVPPAIEEEETIEAK